MLGVIMPLDLISKKTSVLLILSGGPNGYNVLDVKGVTCSDKPREFTLQLCGAY